jgi:hypothetical protein
MNKIYENIQEFFNNNELGTILDISALTRPNFEQLSPPNNGVLQCLTVYLSLNNINIFGKNGSFLTEVFPRYKYLCKMLTDFLNEKGLNVNNEDSTVSVSIVPYPKRNGIDGEPLPILERHSRGQYILPISELTRYSKYYKELAGRFYIEYGVMTNNKTVIGPDGGLIASACMIADTFGGNSLDVAELGTGAGTTPMALLHKNKLKSYYGNDFSPEIAEFFKEKIQPRIKEAGIKASLEIGSCFDINLDVKADLFLVGVYYEGQPEVFSQMGDNIAKSLGSTGVVLIQSGMVENSFINQLLFETRTNHQLWPWYNEDFCIKKRFKYISQQIVEDEIILLGSNNLERFNSALTTLSKHYPVKGLDLI